MGLVGIMLSEVSQRKTNIVCYRLHVESKKNQQCIKNNKKKPTHKHREQISGYQ